MNKLILGDSAEILKTLEDNSVDSVVTDPPAGISFMGKDWDHHKGGRDQWILWLSSIFLEINRVLKPGGHCLVWALPRTSHWTAMALEDAGFEVRDCVYHIFGSGFPKNLNVGKVVDKYLKTGNASWNGTGDSSNGALGYSKLQHKQGYRPSDYSNKHQNKQEITEELAKQYEGWGTALKPAVECWWLVRKPLSEPTVAQNVLKWGTGGINIDGSRIMLKGQETYEAVYKHLSFLYSSACNFSLSVSLCQDFLKNISFVLDSCNKVHKDHLHNVDDLDDSLPLDALCAQMIVRNLYPNDTWCVPNEKIIQDFQVDYPAYSHLYGAQIHQLLNYAQVSAPSLHDVLFYIFQEKSEAIHNQTNLNIVLPSNLDDFLQCLSLLFLYILHKDTTYLSHPQTKGLNAKKWSEPKGGIFHPSQNNNATLENNPQGRFPANLIHDGSEEVLSYFPNTKSGFMKKGTNRLMSSNPNKNTYGHFDPDKVENDTYGDSGSASRFFYCSKPSPSERNFGCENLEDSLIAGGNQAQAELKKGNTEFKSNNEHHSGYSDIRKVKNNHPTVKSIKLMSYLCKLITPPKGIILDPFMGSGTTGISAKLNSFSFIGIEQDKHYFEIAEARIKTYSPSSPKTTKAKIERNTKPIKNTTQQTQQKGFFF